MAANVSVGKGNICPLTPVREEAPQWNWLTVPTIQPVQRKEASCCVSWPKWARLCGMALRLPLMSSWWSSGRGGSKRTCLLLEHALNLPLFQKGLALQSASDNIALWTESHSSLFKMHICIAWTLSSVFAGIAASLLNGNWVSVCWWGLKSWPFYHLQRELCDILVQFMTLRFSKKSLLLGYKYILWS